jgi:hypothetical protein
MGQVSRGWDRRLSPRPIPNVRRRSPASQCGRPRGLIKPFLAQSHEPVTALPSFRGRCSVKRGHRLILQALFGSRGELDVGRDGDTEVRCGAVPDNKNPGFPGISSLGKPSDGLEPSTPSLPWRFWGVTRVHARSRRTPFLLQIAPNEALRMRRETSRVSLLMCPFCVREPLTRPTTAPA